MALSSKIPPQAYTRDTLVKAIEWLSVQPPNVRERATSADLIVSHYLQSRRAGGPTQLDLPVAQESFKSDLRQLAADFRDQPPPPKPQRSPSYVIPPPSAREDLQEPAPPPSSASTRPQTNHLSMRPETPLPAPVSSAPTWEIDTRSLEIARELQDRLNLSSESEAIRLLITMGAERARGLFF